MIAGGILLLLLSLVCLGTWPALLRLCTLDTDGGRLWTSESVEHSPSLHAAGRGRDRPIRRLAHGFAQRRHPCHAYIDYAVAYVLFSSTVPFLLSYFVGSDNNSPNQLSDGDGSTDDDGGQTPGHKLPLISFAFAGGSLLSIGNVSTQWSTAVYGAPLTTVLALQASLTVAIGTALNYRLEPQRTARPDLLAWGVSAFLLAIGLSVRAQRMYAGNAAIGTAIAAARDDGCGEPDVCISMRSLASSPAAAAGPLDYRTCSGSDDGSEGRQSPGVDAERNPSKGTLRQPDVFVGDGGRFPRAAEEECAEANCPPYTCMGAMTSIPPHKPSLTPTMGLVVAFCGGLCFGFFSPAFNIAVNDPFHWSLDSAGLDVATANFWFSVAFAATSVVWNWCLMRNPPASAPAVPRSTIHRYLSGEGISDRALAISAGLVCAGGNVLQFQGGRMAGYAASDLVQAFPLVGTAWDVAAFGEFHGARRSVVVCLSCMYLVYVGGIVLLALSIAT